MKETKVYVDVEPRKIATQLVDLENEQFNCVILMFDTDVKPIEVIVEPKFKTHDRELVKEVCEKIRTMAHKVGKLVFCERCYKTNSARAIDEHLLNEILGQIESEFEQKEYEK